MPIKVLIVDDSGFFRRRVEEILKTDPFIQVVGSAANGEEAIRLNRELKPDVITLDIQMPVMDGITALRKIMREQPTAVLMFSSLTRDGAKPTLEALEAGALDYIPKNFTELASDANGVQKLLCDKVREVSRVPKHKLQQLRAPSVPVAAGTAPRAGTSHAPVSRPAERVLASSGRKRYDLLLIGTSTGGPAALQTVLTQLPANFPVPILLIQHMPASFTGAFARRLNEQCQIEVCEATDHQTLKPGVAYLAPGGKQMLLDRRRNLQIVDGDPRENYKPCVDRSFESVADNFNGRVLAMVLTGMGADGAEGAKRLKQRGATVWAQDEASCVIYGMPAAVVNSGSADKVLALDTIAAQLVEVF